MHDENSSAIKARLDLIKNVAFGIGGAIGLVILIGHKGNHFSSGFAGWMKGAIGAGGTWYAVQATKLYMIERGSFSKKREWVLWVLWFSVYAVAAIVRFMAEPSLLL
jgi:hypothetical protein